MSVHHLSNSHFDVVVVVVVGYAPHIANTIFSLFFFFISFNAAKKSTRIACADIVSSFVYCMKCLEFGSNSYKYFNLNLMKNICCFGSFTRLIWVHGRCMKSVVLCTLLLCIACYIHNMKWRNA